MKKRYFLDLVIGGFILLSGIAAITHSLYMFSVGLERWITFFNIVIGIHNFIMGLFHINNYYKP